jgi:hypothetical protein
MHEQKRIRGQKEEKIIIKYNNERETHVEEEGE